MNLYLGGFDLKDTIEFPVLAEVTKSYPNMYREARVSANPTYERKVAYAVKVGRQPGIYPTWSDAKMQVDGFVGAKYKGFGTREEAVAYMGAADITKYYAVRVGHQPGIYTSWDEAKPHTSMPGAKFKSFLTLEEAQAFMGGVGGVLPPGVVGPAVVIPPAYSIWCDGSCLGNGKTNAGTGWSAVVKQGDTTIQTYSGQVPVGPHGEKPTNQRAELMAALEALSTPQAQAATVEAPVEIVTDSQYTIDCITVWPVTHWQTAGQIWYKKDGKPVLNQDLIRPAVEAYQKGRHRFRHVPAHTGIQGNEEVDRLAKLQAQINGYRGPVGKKGPKQAEEETGLPEDDFDFPDDY